MTKKRYRKLARAYFTEINEWAKTNHSDTMNIGSLYRIVANLQNPNGMSREEWCEALLAPNHIKTGKRI